MARSQQLNVKPHLDDLLSRSVRSPARAGSSKIDRTSLRRDCLNGVSSQLNLWGTLRFHSSFACGASSIGLVSIVLKLKVRRRHRTSRSAISELSLEALADKLGGEHHAKAFWKLLREGKDPFVEQAGGLGREARSKLQALDSRGILAKALRPDVVESVVGPSTDLSVEADECGSPLDTQQGEAWFKKFADHEEAVREGLGAGFGTTKLLLRLHDGLAVEAVLIPQVEAFAERRQKLAGRRQSSTTLCVSSQVGCSQGCRFCRTGEMGIVRDLESDEILAQVAQGRRLVNALGQIGRAHV